MSLTFTQTGDFDFAHSRGMIAMTAPLSMTELFLPPKVYVKVPADGSAALPHGKTWLVMDAGSAGPLDSPFGEFGGGSDPTDMLASLTAIAGSERVLGATRVRGVPVTGYQVNIDPSKLAARAPAAERASLRQFAQSLGKSTVPVDVWVDNENEVRQVRLSPRTPGGTMIPGNPRLTLTVDFYDFGVPVDVSAPPAAQVTSLGAAGMGEVSGGIISSASASAVASVLPVASLTPGPAGAVPPGAPIVSASPLPAQG